MLQVEFILLEQQLCYGGLLFRLSPLDDAVIEASSSHPDGLATSSCNNKIYCKIV